MSIELVEVEKAFGPKRILNGFSLEVAEGETVAIIGQSGSGKSVTLKHIIGLLRPDSGTVIVDGEKVPELEQSALYELRRNVGYVFQFAALFDSMTVAENVGMGLRRMPGVTPAEIERRVQECLGLVDLPGYGDRYPAELSGGEKKRAGVARAIATKPKYLLYDEPTTGLDPVTTTVIDDLIERMADELGVTGIMVTHDMQSAYRVADKVAMLYDGRVRFHGSPAEIQACDDPVVSGFIRGQPELMKEGQ